MTKEHHQLDRSLYVKERMKQRSIVEMIHQIEVIEDTRCPGDWRVEAVGADGECYVAIFSGPRAETRAREYARWRYG